MKTNKTVSGVPYQVRQGDVFLERIDDASASQGDGELKPAVSRDNLTVVANGEVTGHRHVLDGVEYGGVRDATPHSSRFWTPGGVIDESGRLEVDSDAHLKHDTHSTLPVPAGNYRVIKQREYMPAAPPRRVLD